MTMPTLTGLGVPPRATRSARNASDLTVNFGSSSRSVRPPTITASASARSRSTRALSQAEEIADDVMNHLEAAEEALRETWGQSEFTRLSQNATRLGDFGPAARIAFGEARLNDAVSSLSAEEAGVLSSALGKYVLNEVHRQLLLSAFSELWVEYLTKVEGLRVSIGLEAYAQRDPLVQYKGRASEMFSQLVEDIRGLVIGRVFAYQPRPIEIKPVETSVTQEEARSVESDGNKKKKRRRH